MACFFQGSIPWMVLVFPIVAVFATFSPGPGIFFIAITVSAVLYFWSPLIVSKLSKQKSISVDSSKLKEASTVIQRELSPRADVAEEILTKSEEDSKKDSEEAVPAKARELDGAGDEFSIRSRHSSSENESNARYSSTEDEGDHFSDIEWPYNIEQRINCSDDGSISDEESLIEIAIPSGQFVSSPVNDPKCCCKLSQESIFLKNMDLDFFPDSEMNEEDNLIEIDIYMGSIKCSGFGI